MLEQKYYFTKEGYEKAREDITKTVFGKVNQQEQEDLKIKYYNAILVENTPDYKNWDGKTVIVKSSIEVDYDGEIEEYTILGCNESDTMNNILSSCAPLSKVLIGKKVGEKVNFRGCEITILNVNKLDYDFTNAEDLTSQNSNNGFQKVLKLNK